ncbi:hypothetical protein Tco_0656199 [Tanacetum coccineum]|uniref:Uncharacterized protein n=1 Tax=Tanacetum coccineum TaxID=301880 RepID=A0ABQ4X8R2_9ASTR
MEIPDIMIDDAFKKSTRYKYYKAKYAESEKAKDAEEPEEQNESLIRSGRGKCYMRLGDNEANVPKMFKKDVMPRKKDLSLSLKKQLQLNLQNPSVLTNNKLKGPAVDDPAVQSLLDLQKGSKANTSEESAKETDDADDSDMDLSHDNPKGDNDTTRYGKFMYNKSTEMPKSTYFSPTITSSSLDFIQNLLDETHISLFTKPSTSTDDLSGMDLKLKLMHKIHECKSNTTNLTNQKLYDTLYESICLDTLNAQEDEPSFHKRSHNNQDPLNNREGENRKKKTKDVGEPSSRPSRRNKSPVCSFAQDRDILPYTLDQEDEYIRTRLNPEWYTKSGPTGFEKLKQQYQNNVKLEYHVDQLKAVVLSEAKWNSDEDDVSKPRFTKEKYITSITKHYAARYYIQGIEDMISDRWCKETHRYHFEALNGIHHWEDSKIDFFQAEKMRKPYRRESLLKFKYQIRRSNDKEYELSYADLPRLNLNDVEDMYLLQVQDKLHHLLLEFVKDFNDAFLLGKGNRRLKGKDWTDNDVIKSNEMVKKID